ncbi:unnamed protein product [Didymodactylos carnosus]|uniref:Arf-GAP domain-containing protein n=1 Tax=Didymodactylos carnosus TaxID=1234261 RepID=A0A813NP70_9BILA|nr:unnamed protein product [Didymodactylos carnosus]CAF0754079.1 unnamed protein product [Didymodactylos carnosus]CAF3519398.1 unnamed protein product [Didymodactylos carnosus]CAF3533118.1 unnamed protein product [Didymodactylos carnosus]
MPRASDNPTTTKFSNECNDCGQTGTQWSSLNHGVLLCDECCSVHLSLGRHVSQIKSFKRSHWPPSQLNLIQELNQNGANLVWEYNLLDPQNKVLRKKPNAKDSLPIKADFIRAKYQQLAYINRLKDETSLTFEDLHQQLHSIARTDNVTTCLRFLSQGADPNYKNPETGTSSLHVAASRGQMNQVELLCIFGADPAFPDNSGISPEQHARSNGYIELSERLVELQHELTDRLTYFICNKRPDHRNGQHLIIPDISDNLDTSDSSRSARRKLQQLPDSLFEDLAMDVFDEVERRELDTIWHAQVEKHLQPLYVVPFLPVNSIFSATRNQGRQKLARYGVKEFTILIYDILNEIRRRHYGMQSPVQQSKFHTIPRQHVNMNNNTSLMSNDTLLPMMMNGIEGQTGTFSNIYNGTTSSALINAFIDSDDEPLYDKVASDEDYSSLPINHRSKLIHKDKQANNMQKLLKRIKKNSSHDYIKEQSPDILHSPSESLNLSDVSNEENHIRLQQQHQQQQNNLKTRVTNTETQLKFLSCAHVDLKNEIAVLHQMIQRLLDESLLNKVDQQMLDMDNPTTSPNDIMMSKQSKTSRIQNNEIVISTTTTTNTTTNGHTDGKNLEKSNCQLFDSQNRKSSPIIESDYDNTTILDDSDKSITSPNHTSGSYNREKRSSRSMHRFPYEDIKMNSLAHSRPFRSTDWVNGGQPSSGSPLASTISPVVPSSSMAPNEIFEPSDIQATRARSCSGGRNKSATSPACARKVPSGPSSSDIDKRTRKITHRIAEMFQLIKENQFDSFSMCADRINHSVYDMIRLFPENYLTDETHRNLEMLTTGSEHLLLHSKEKRNRNEQIQLIIDDSYNIALALKRLVVLHQQL